DAEDVTREQFLRSHLEGQLGLRSAAEVADEDVVGPVVAEERGQRRERRGGNDRRDVCLLPSPRQESLQLGQGPVPGKEDEPVGNLPTQDRRIEHRVPLRPGALQDRHKSAQALEIRRYRQDASAGQETPFTPPMITDSTAES